ncbi:MAG: ATP-binding cassette domain-containing protein [bacterium]|nr:ATP-binding cassette domain-containing protein [bacterium]MCY4103562.1 ATP-binding cassette domain-containing protein [bacterium]
MSDPLLAAEKLTVRHGNQVAVDGVTTRVAAGESLAILGRNGSGKSSLADAIAGVVECEGSLQFGGQDVSTLSPHDRRRLGLATVREGHRVLPGLTVDDNLQAAATMMPRRAVADAIAAQYRLFPPLSARAGVAADALSGGEQQMLAIAQALLARPKMLVIDEMSLGLAPAAIAALVPVLSDAVAGGTALMVIEQNVEVAIRLCQRVLVLETGRVAFESDSLALRENPARIRHLYLGDF